MFRNYTLFICAFSLIALSNLYLANSAVVGLDLGGEFMKISSISPGKSFYIVEDTTTKRKTPTSIAFYNNERIFEYDTLVKRPRAYQTTFTNLPKFLGKSFDDPKLKEQAKTYLEDYIISESERGTPSFSLKNFKIGGEDETSYSLTIEELLGMIFRHVSRLIQKQTERQLKDIAVTVPPYFAFSERYALHDALVLADFNPLAFMSENTGAALYYALERLDTEPHRVIFYNLGSTSLKVSLVEFSTQNSTEKHEKNASYESLTVLAETWDQDLGSLNFDLNLLNHFASEFDNKPGRKGQKSILTSNPAKAKILKEVNKLKEILSANKQAQIYLENLFESTDFKSTIDRTTFEELNAELFKRLTKPVDEVLAKAGKTIDDIHAFELIGGGIRIPKIQQILSEHLNGKEVSTHLNGDESMALGAAFHAANLSASFKTRQIYVNDGYNFDIRVELKDLEPVEVTEENPGLNKSAVLFPYKTRFGSKKVLAFEHDGAINASFFATLPGQDGESNVISFAITGLEEGKQDPKLKDKDLGKTKINLHFRLSPLGLIELTKAEATVEEIILYEDTTTTTKTEEAKEEAKETTEEDAEKAEGDAEAPKETEESEPEKKFKRKTVTHHIPLKVTAQTPAPGPMTEDQLEKSRDLLSKFDHSEEQKKKIAEAKNKLEAYLYATRDYLEDDSFSASAKEEEKESLKQMLEEHSEWLYTSEAASANHTPFTKKFEEMEKIVNKIKHRVTERVNRPELIEKAKETLSGIKDKLSDIITLKPWITEEARDKAISQVEEIKTWLTETLEKQEALLHHDDPVLTSSQVSTKLERAKGIFDRIKNTVKPKAPKNETAGGDYTFGKDGKFDEASFKEYMKKMNVTMEDLEKYRKQKEEESQQKEKEAESAEKTETNDEETKKTEEEEAPRTEETQEEPEEPKKKFDTEL